MRPADVHEQVESLLPWYATGQLEAADQALVERHLSTCETCCRQVALDRRLADEFQSLAAEVDAGWTLLRRRIESEADPRPGLGQTVRDFWAILRQPAVAALAMAQIAVVIVSGTILLSLGRPTYHALGSPDAARTANVLIIFRAQATEKDIREALRASGASLAGGPTAAGAYLVEVPADQRAPALARLRSDDDVQTAEPIDGARP